MTTTVRSLADEFNLQLEGRGDVVVTGVAPLDRAGANEVAFCRDRKQYPLLSQTRAAAVILDEQAAAKFPGTKLISRNPHADFARVAAHLNPVESIRPGIDPTAQIADDAEIAPTAFIGPSSVIGRRAVVGDNVRVGPFCYIGNNVTIGSDTEFVAHVSVMDRCRIGRRVILHPGCVVGGDGFGYAREDGKWLKVPQLGAVVIGDDVEIGASTTVDRGSLDDTIIGNGVKIDNQVQIGHNVRIGDHTIIVACVGIGGSAVIGQRCAIGGGVKVAGHLHVADGTTIQATSLVASSIDTGGVYASHIPVQPIMEWRRILVRMKQLDIMARRLEQLERQTKRDVKEGDD